jgi:crossover junction endodeoxyribonuclease RuvC
MIVLGVDAGSLSTGYGVVEAVGNRHRALDYGAIRNVPERTHPERLARIHARLLEVIDRYGPAVLALEEAFVARNAQSALKLGQVRGAVMVAAIGRGLEVMEFSPAEVKAAVTGHGRAEKAQVQLMVKALLGLTRVPEPHDAADALAVAICALGSAAWRRKVGRP